MAFSKITFFLLICKQFQISLCESYFYRLYVSRLLSQAECKLIKKNEKKLIIGYIISCYRFDRHVTVSWNVCKTWAPVKGNLTKIKLLSASDCIYCKRSHGEEFFCWLLE